MVGNGGSGACKSLGVTEHIFPDKFRSGVRKTGLGTFKAVNLNDGVRLNKTKTTRSTISRKYMYSCGLGPLNIRGHVIPENKCPCQEY